MTLPSYIAAGTAAGSTSDITPTVGTHAAGDLLLLIVETGGETVSAPSGWTEMLGSPFKNPTNATWCTIFYKFTAGGESNPTVTDPGDHAYGRVFTFRGVDTTDPFHVVAGMGRNNDSSGVAFTPQIVTKINDCLILAIWAWSNDTVGPLSSGEANSTLANVTERSDDGTTQGNGGGIVLITGEKATAGAVAQTSATTGVAVGMVGVTVALSPVIAPSSSGGASLSRVVNHA